MRVRTSDCYTGCNLGTRRCALVCIYTLNFDWFFPYLPCNHYEGFQKSECFWTRQSQESLGERSAYVLLKSVFLQRRSIAQRHILFLLRLVTSSAGVSVVKAIPYTGNAQLNDFPWVSILYYFILEVLRVARTECNH